MRGFALDRYTIGVFVYRVIRDEMGRERQRVSREGGGDARYIQEENADKGDIIHSSFPRVVQGRCLEMHCKR